MKSTPTRPSPLAAGNYWARFTYSRPLQVLISWVKLECTNYKLFPREENLLISFIAVKIVVVGPVNIHQANQNSKIKNIKDSILNLKDLVVQ
jgi:hypothetical protein